MFIYVLGGGGGGGGEHFWKKIDFLKFVRAHLKLSVLTGRQLPWTEIIFHFTYNLF